MENTKFKLIHLGSIFENEIFWRGIEHSWEAKSIILWKRICKNCDTILDIGANSGFYSLLSVAVNPNASLYAFEPIERILAVLEKNVALNDFRNITIVPIALSSTSGVSSIYDDPTISHIRQASLEDHFLNGPDKKAVKITTSTGSDFIEKYKIDKIDLIKLDVEDHEIHVLRGFGEYLQQMKPIIMIEVQTNHSEVEDILRSNGYGYFINVEEKSGFREVKTFMEGAGRNYFCFRSKQHFYDVCSDSEGLVVD